MKLSNNNPLIKNNRFTKNKKAERRQIIVMCFWLKIRYISDKKANLELIDILHENKKNQCVEIAIRYGGFHVGSLGDTILFYFGYPNNSDNDSRSCAMTATKMINYVKKDNILLRESHGVETEIHIGIHAGIVACQNYVEHQGHIVNTAMELARLASPNQILCSTYGKTLLDVFIEMQPGKLSSKSMDASKAYFYSYISETLDEIPEPFHYDKTYRGIEKDELEVCQQRPEIELTFNVSQNEEHVSLNLAISQRRFDLGQRNHHYLLLLLARKRMADNAKGIILSEQGWIYLEQLCQMLKLNENHINVQIYRIRKQMTSILPQSLFLPQIIERRTGQIRIVYDNAKVNGGAKLAGSPSLEC